MNDMNKQFETMGAQLAAGAPTSYSHAQSDVIRDECQSLLRQIPEGQRLLEFLKTDSCDIKILNGKKVDWKSAPDAKIAYLFCPVPTKAIGLEEITLGYAIAARELEQPKHGIYQPNPNHPPEMAFQTMLEYFLDITMEMSKIVAEFAARDPNTKFLDLIKKLGHNKFYSEYISGKNKEELREILKRTLINND